MKKLNFFKLILIILSITFFSAEATAVFVLNGADASFFANNADAGCVANYDEAGDLTKKTSENSLYKKGGTAERVIASAEEIAKLPSYDPRAELTPVRDQGTTNLCWAYSAINASEASILKSNLGEKDNLRLNPRALAYRKYVRNADPLGNNANYYDKNESNWLSNPGHIRHTAAVLSMWQGPISDAAPTKADVWGNSLYRLENANLIRSGLTGDARIAEIKRAIAEYGAVTASCNYDGGTRQYYNDASVKNGIPHAITLVGWNDEIDKGLFRPTAASENGGWLVKNSYSDNGYFWLTYGSKIADSAAWTFSFAPRNAYDYNYYYDNNEEDFALFRPKSCANVFEAKKGTADKPEYLEAVNIGFYGNDVSVKIKVYTGLSGWGQTSVENGVLAAEKTQTFRYGGYNTVRLDLPVILNAGSYYSIVAEVSDANGSAYLKTVQSDSKKPSFQKTSDGYAAMINGTLIARIKAYTKLKEAEAGGETHNHNYGQIVPTESPTCSAAGVKAHYQCSDCKKYFDENKNETTTEKLKIAINPDAHDFNAWTDEIPANCEKTGVKAHKSCKLCNKNFDANGGELTSLTLPKNGEHLWGEWTSNKDGTHSRRCERDSSHTETEKCTGGTATCTEKAVCETCKAAYGETLGGSNGSGNETGDINGGGSNGSNGDSGGDTSGGTEEAVPSEKQGLSGGAVAGIVIGTTAAGCAGFALVWFVVKKKTFAALISAIKGLFIKR